MDRPSEIWPLFMICMARRTEPQKSNKFPFNSALATVCRSAGRVWRSSWTLNRTCFWTCTTDPDVLPSLSTNAQTYVGGPNLRQPLQWIWEQEREPNTVVLHKTPYLWWSWKVRCTVTCDRESKSRVGWSQPLVTNPVFLLTPILASLNPFTVSRQIFGLGARMSQYQTAISC